MKSAALSLPSVGVGTSLLTSVNSRTKLYSDVLPKACGKAVPSRNTSQIPPALPINPTASSLLAVEIESGSTGREETDVEVALDVSRQRLHYLAA